MTKEKQLLILKAQAFERIANTYRTLENDAGFYSKNWVVLSEIIEQEMNAVEKVRSAAEED